MRRTRRIGLTEADRLVAGHRTDPELRGLTGLLDAAGAPATERELAGERAAVAGFLAARQRAVPAEAPKGRNRERVPLSVRTSAMKVAAGFAVLAVSGTAFAARTGNLPETAQERAHALFSLVGVPAPEISPNPSPGGEVFGAPPSAHVPSRTPAPGPSRSAGPGDAAVRQLCQDWVAAQGDPPGKAIAAQSRRALAAAAGGMPKIDGFCAALLAGTPSPSTTTTEPGQPTATPSHPGNGNGNGNGSGNGNGNNGNGNGKGNGRSTATPGPKK